MTKKLWKWTEGTIHFIIYRIFHMKLSEDQWMDLLQFVKFGLVGVLNNFICYAVYLALVTLGFHYIFANIIGFSASVFNAFFWNNKYVFVAKNKRVWWKTFIRTYLSYAGTGIILSNILLVFWIEVCRVPNLVGPILNLIFTIPINFLLNKLWAYKS